MELPEWTILAGVVIAGLATGVLLGVLLSSGGEPDPQPAPQPDHSFVTYRPGAPALYLWAIETGRVALPDGVSLRVVARSGNASSFIGTGNAVARALPPNELGTGLRSNQVRILPYYLALPEDMFGIYVPVNASIQNPDDLRGTTIAIPRGIASAEVARILLNDVYNVTGANTEFVRPATPEAGDADAVWRSFTDVESGERAVFLPFGEMQRRFGWSGFPLYFVASRQNTELTEGVMDTVREAVQDGKENPSAVIHHIAQSTGTSEDTWEPLRRVLENNQTGLEQGGAEFRDATRYLVQNFSPDGVEAVRFLERPP